MKQCELKDSGVQVPSHNGIKPYVGFFHKAERKLNLEKQLGFLMLMFLIVC